MEILKVCQKEVVVDDRTIGLKKEPLKALPDLDPDVEEGEISQRTREVEAKDDEKHEALEDNQEQPEPEPPADEPAVDRADREATTESGEPTPLVAAETDTAEDTPENTDPESTIDSEVEIPKSLDSQSAKTEKPDLSGSAKVTTGKRRLRSASVAAARLPARIILYGLKSLRQPSHFLLRPRRIRLHQQKARSLPGGTSYRQI